MVVAICVLELHLPAVRSLKQKRKVVKGLVERLHQRLRISVAETAFHDLHQRSEIGMALVAQGEMDARRLLDKARELVDQEFDAQVLSWSPEILDSAD